MSGGNGCFRALRTGLDPVDQRLEELLGPVEQSVANVELLAQLVCPDDPGPTPVPGERLLIVTPQALASAAQDLADHKATRGLTASVVTTESIAGGGAPLTDAALRDHLLGEYDAAAVRPKWVLLLGDAELIPTHYEEQNIFETSRNAGDQYYAQRGDALSARLYGVGRIPVDTAAQAAGVVAKIKAFETSPPDGASGYYAKETFAAHFQDDDLDGREDRRYVETAEHVRDHQSALGRNADRVYFAAPASDPQAWQGGDPIPAALRKPGFAWGGSTAQIVSAFNAGSSILFHRDHGWWWGWATPMFSTSEVGSVAAPDTRFPIIFSVNCASGIFDNETVDLPEHRIGAGYGPDPAAVYWAEQLLRKSTGALAIIGDTRSSDTVLNDDMAKGLWDAPFPDYLPFGPAAPVTRLGDVLDHAKAYLASLAYAPADLAQELTIYNLLGDPTLEVLTAPPAPAAQIANGGGGGSGGSGGGLGLLGDLLQVPLAPLALPFDQMTVVALDGAGQVLGRAIPSALGLASVPVGSHAGLTRLVVTGPGLRPAATTFTLLR